MSRSLKGPLLPSAKSQNHSIHKTLVPVQVLMGNYIFRGCRRPKTYEGDDDRNRRKTDKRPIKKPSKQDIYSLNNQIDVLEAPTGHDITQHYKIGDELGRGEFGITYLCTEKSTGKKYACKLISKQRLITRVDREDMRREVDIMRHMPQHPNIVSLRDTFEDDCAVYLVMELCEGGELFDRIKACEHYSERAAAGLIKTVVEVVQICHRYGVMHRDLKPENFLFANKKENAPLKAIDFGLSVFFKPGQVFTEVVGSPYYMAPEVLKRNYGPEIDVWSAGVILYILLCGAPPFWADTEQGIPRAIIRSQVDFTREPWPKVSHYAKDLIKQMLEPEPKKRLTAQQVLDHPWLHNLKKAPDVALGESLRTRLQQFTVMNKFKKKALSVIAERLTIDEEADIKQMFEELDVEKKGELTFDELQEALQKQGHDLPESDARMIMAAVDVDGDGTLNYGEFMTVSIHIRRMGNDEHLHKAFAFFDKNKTGYIEIEELTECLINDIGSNHEEIINAILHDVDTDKDGKISYEEFANMMKVGTDWRIASRQYSRERLNNLSWRLLQEGIVPAA